MGQFQSPYHLLSFPIAVMAAALLLFVPQNPTLAADTDIDGANKVIECTHDLVVVSSAQPADLASALNLDTPSNDIGIAGTDWATGVQTNNETVGPSARTTAERYAGNRLIEGVQSSLIRFDPTPKFYVAERSLDYRQRALTRCPRSQANTT